MNYRKHQNSKEVNRIVEERYLQDKFLIESKKDVCPKCGKKKCDCSGKKETKESHSKKEMKKKKIICVSLYYTNYIRNIRL